MSDKYFNPKEDSLYETMYKMATAFRESLAKYNLVDDWNWGWDEECTFDEDEEDFVP